MMYRFMSIAAVAAIASASAVTNDGLISHWSFDGGWGSECTDLVRPDSFCVLHNAGCATGSFGTSLCLSGNNSFAELPPLAELDGAEEMTISVWCLWNKCGTRHPNILSAGWHPNSGYLIFVADKTCNFRIGGFNKEKTRWREASAGFVSPISPNKWVHLAVTFKRPNVITYVNGKKAGSCVWDDVVGSKMPITVGAWGSPNTHDGLIDDLRFYKRALSPAEISELAADTGRAGAEYKPVLPPPPVEIGRWETPFAEIAIANDGTVTSLIQKANGKQPMRDFSQKDGNPQICNVVLNNGRTLRPYKVSRDGDVLTALFPNNLGSVKIRVTSVKDGYFRFTPESLDLKDVKKLVFFRIGVPLVKYVGHMAGMASDDDSGVCLRSLSLGCEFSYSTSQKQTILNMATDTPDKAGLTGHGAGLVIASRDNLLPILRKMAENEPVPVSKNGGPWAMVSPDARGSYLFADLEASKTDAWIELAERGGFTYIHLHGWWETLGHYNVNRRYYPGGLEEMKQVADKIHAAGLKAGIHTLTACIEPMDPWVSPVPSPDLIPVATYTLAKPFAVGDKVMYVNEMPVEGHELVWSYSCNGNAFRIGTEIIRYNAISREKPYAFLQCERGAFKTREQNHAQGEKADYLQQRYIAFYPQPDSKLADDLADGIAKVFKECKLDMIYFDGSEGMRSRFGIDTMRWKIFDRIKPAVTEASCWGHNSWWIHTRLGAWDHPTWAMRDFHDAHIKSAALYRMNNLLEPQLGWWAPRGVAPHARGHFMDETEYFACKNLSIDGPMSIQGVNASRRPPNARLPEMMTLLGWYERIRLARYFDEATINRIKPLKEDFRLRPTADGGWKFRSAALKSNKVNTSIPNTTEWSVENEGENQDLHARIELLYNAANADSSRAIMLADFSDQTGVEVNKASGFVKPEIALVEGDVKGTAKNLQLTVTNEGKESRGSWASVVKTFPHPYVGVMGRQGISLWIKGDGSGAMLDVQVCSPREYYGGISDHLVKIDFTGWRCVNFFFRERDADKMDENVWPKGGLHAIARMPLDTNHLSKVSLTLNNVQPGKTARITVGPVMAVPVTKTSFSNLTLNVNGGACVLPNAESGDYIELEGANDCAQYNERGTLLGRFKLKAYPQLVKDANAFALSGKGEGGEPLRAQVDVFALGEPFGTVAKDVDWSKMRREFDMPRSFTRCDGVDNVWTVYRRNSNGAAPNGDDARMEFTLDVDNLVAVELPEGKDGSCKLDACADIKDYTPSKYNDYAKFAFDSENQGTSKPGVTFNLEAVQGKSSDGAIAFNAVSTRKDRAGWAAAGKRFAKPLDLSNAKALTLWVKGDGKNESLKLQLRDTKGLWHDMVRTIDFSGWKRIDFNISSASLDLSKVEYLIYYYNGIPGGDSVGCVIDEVKTVPNLARIEKPVLTVNGETFVFDAALRTSDRLFCSPDGAWNISNPSGAVTSKGNLGRPLPLLKAGANSLRLDFGVSNVASFLVSGKTAKTYK